MIPHFDVQIVPDLGHMNFNNIFDSKKLCELGQVIVLFESNFPFWITGELH